MPYRQKRMQVGLDMVLNLLGVADTWIPLDWDKACVTLIQPNGEQGTENRTTLTPYVSHPDLMGEVNHGNGLQQSDKTQKYLLTLGILLLELLFGQTLESQPYRASFMGPDGNPNSYMDMCTAMEWQKKVELEVGDGLPEVIQRCVYCDFGVERDLSNPKFVKAVFDLVVVPIRDFLSRWNTNLTPQGISGSE